MADLLKLAERVEAAAGPDRELDALIGVACGMRGEPWGCISPTKPIRAGSSRDPNFSRGAIEFDLYTASLDAAMTLVPEKWLVHFIQEIEYRTAQPRPWTVELRYREEFIEPGTTGPCAEQTWSATPALAVTSACLLARAGSKES